MTTIEVSAPDGGRAVFTRRGDGPTQQWATAIPGEVELPQLPGDGYFQVTLREDETSAWSESFAIQPPSGNHALADLPRLPLGEAASGGFSLMPRVAALEADLAAASGEWDQLSDRVRTNEQALWLVEDVFTDNLLEEITWWESGSSFTVPLASPEVSRSYRVEADLVTEALQVASGGRIWLRVRNGSTVLVTTGNIDNLASSDTGRYRTRLDFNATAGADLNVQVGVHGGIQGGRIGLLGPVVTTPVERSA